MKKCLFSFSLLVLLNCAFFAQKPTPTPDDDVVKISTNLIQIDVIVTDNKGKIVTDLKPEDFEIYENGKKQEMTNFLFVNTVTQTKTVEAIKKPKGKEDKSAMPIPPIQLKPEQVKRTVALIVDDLGLSFESMARVRNSLKRFVDEQMLPDDLVAIIAVGNGAGTLQQFTSDKRQLYAAIEKLKWNAQGRAGITPFAPLGQISMNTTAQSTTTTDENGNVTETTDLADLQQQMYSNNLLSDIFATGTLGAINYVVKGMTELPGRKSVMLFSDGFPVCTIDTSTGESDLDQCKRMEEALKRLTDFCNRASVTIYSFDARGLLNTMPNASDNVSIANTVDSVSTRSMQITDNQQGLEILANDTGGRTFFNRNDLTDTISYALDDQKGYYLLAYQPDETTFDAKKLRYNKLEIKLKRKDLVVRYRTGFYGVIDAKPLENVSTNPTDKTVAALMSPFTASEIPLRLNTLFGNNQTGSFVNSYLHIDAKKLTFVDQPDGTKKLNFDVLASSFGENGETIEQVGRAYRLNVPAETYKQMMEEGFVYSFIFPVKKAGAFQMRVAVRDGVSSKLGSASQFVEVPDLKKGRLQTSGIVLENFVEDPTKEPLQHATVNDITIGKGDPRTDTSLRKFQQGTFLRYILEIYNAKLDKTNKPNVQTQIRVFRDGKPVLNNAPKAIELGDQKDLSRILFGGKLALGKDLPVGEYILQIIVKDNLAKEKNNLTSQWVQFEIVD
jgi:VWFA-related protein